MGAFEGLLQEGSHPAYFLFLELDPKRIDINVHPTKTEIKFEEEQAVYAILQSAIRRALSQYHVAPSLDFDRETGLDGLDLYPKSPETVRQPQISVNPDYNPFSNPRPAARVPDGWQEVYQIAASAKQNDIFPEHAEPETAEMPREQNVFQLHQRYICAQIKSGMLLIDQHAAHERILYERYLHQQQSSNSQRLLFPEQLPLAPADVLLLAPVLADIRKLGFDLEAVEGGLNVLGLPGDLQLSQLAGVLEELLEQLRNQQEKAALRSRDQLARVLARYGAIAAGKVLEKAEMNLLIDQLFACEQPHFSPDGRHTLIQLSLEEIARRFV
jgi:DNA mismatch repair protein MutL